MEPITQAPQVPAVVQVTIVLLVVFAPIGVALYRLFTGGDR